jgi:hypothetical protein
VYYENLCLQPQVEMSTVFQSIGQDPSETVIANTQRPSQTARVTSAIVNGTDKINNWRNILEPRQIDNILHIVERFGLGNLYGSSPLPLRQDAQ